MTRVQLDMSGADVVTAMSDGNPGGLTVMLNIMQHTKDIDPQSVMGSFAHIRALDTLGIYGSDIWMLYKDICGESIEKTIAVLRAWQLGFVGDKDIRASIAGTAHIDADALLTKVKERLPLFGDES